MSRGEGDMRINLDILYRWLPEITSNVSETKVKYIKALAVIRKCLRVSIYI